MKHKAFSLSELTIVTAGGRESSGIHLIINF